MQNHDLVTVPGPEAVIFDLEGTIIDTEPIWDHGTQIFLRRRGRVYDSNITKHLVMGRTAAEGAAIMQAQYDFPGDPVELGAERKEIIYDLLANEVDLIPGFDRFYETVSAAYPTAIATSMERALFKRVDRRLGLAELFGGHVYSIEDIGFIAKPNPDIFLYAAARLGVNPKRCVAVEDAPHGVTSAKAAGMYCVALTTSVGPEHLQHADQIVDHYDDIVIPS